MKVFDLKIDERALSIIARALGELPYRIAQPIIESIDAQVANQERPDVAAAVVSIDRNEQKSA